MKISDILKKSIENEVKNKFKENLNENISDVKTSQELTGYFRTLIETAKEKMEAYTDGVLSILTGANKRYFTVYERFMEQFKDYITGELKCDVEYGTAQLYFSTSVSNSDEAWDDFDSQTNEFGNMLEKFYVDNIECSADVAYESKETIIIALKIKLISEERLPKIYSDLLKDIDPSLIDEYNTDDYED